jgi:hypothetical protein
MSCPSEDCRGIRPEQCELSAAEMSIVALGWRDRVARCSACGCVYTRDERGRPTIRGWLDNKVAGPGWRGAAPLSRA